MFEEWLFWFLFMSCMVGIICFLIDTWFIWSDWYMNRKKNKTK